MFGLMFGNDPYNNYGHSASYNVKTIVVGVVIILCLLIGTGVWARGMLRDRELAEFKNAQVEEALRRKDAEIARREQDLADIEELNKSLQAEVDWARVQVNRREREMADLKAASTIEVQECLELVIEPGFLP